jgi:hypothetical protein
LGIALFQFQEFPPGGQLQFMKVGDQERLEITLVQIRFWRRWKS